MKFLRTPPFGDPKAGAIDADSVRTRMDLDAGVNKAIKKEEESFRQERLKHLLIWAKRNGYGQKEVEDAPDFVCFRGHFTAIMATPYENLEGWKLVMVKHRGTVYINKEETDSARENRLCMDDRQRRMCSWGYKFEQYMTSDDPRGGPTNTNEPVDECEQFCCVFSSKLGKNTFVYGAEMDGLEASDSTKACDRGDPKNQADLNKETFVELKTSRIVEHPGHERSLRRHKMLKWWCQTFTVGVPKIICGFRDDRGVVRNVRQYHVGHLPRLCQEHWMANVCMNFLHWFLDEAKRRISQLEELTVVEFTWNPGDSFIAYKTLNDEDNEVMLEAILPHWYRDGGESNQN